MAETAVVLPLLGSAKNPVTGDATDLEVLFDRWGVRDGQTNPGMPMHVTVMVPFVDGDLLTVEALNQLQDLLSRWEPFDCRFETVRTFQGPPRRAWLAPEPAAPFIEMTRAIMTAYSGLTPYGGEHDEIVPHVSVSKERDPDPFDRSVREMGSDLPIVVRMSTFSVYELRDGRWILRTDRPLGVAAM